MKKLLLLSIACALVQHAAMAGGFKIGLQGQRQIGMAHTGIGLAQDAATIYFNPAGLSFVENQVNGGVSGIIPRIQYLDVATNASTRSENQIFTPFSLYGSYHLNNTPLTFGLGVYTPFGSGVKYPTDWTGRFVLTNINLQAVYIQPTVAYKVTDFLSFGAGFVGALGHVELEKQLPLYSSLAGTEAAAKLEGNAQGWGYNLGMYFTGGEKFSAGITYHSQVDMKVDNGSATFTNIPFAAASSFPNTSFKTECPLPAELGIGGAYKIYKNLTLAADFNYTLWESFESLGFDYAINTDKLTDDASPRLYKNAWAVRGGLQWDASKRTTIRGGAFYDRTPVQEGYVNPELPDNDKIGFSLGATYWLSDRVCIDASLLYEDVAARTTLNNETKLFGTYKTLAIIPGIGASYNFNKQVTNRINKF